jgi:hypothetical protein
MMYIDLEGYILYNEEITDILNFYSEHKNRSKLSKNVKKILQIK